MSYKILESEQVTYSVELLRRKFACDVLCCIMSGVGEGAGSGLSRVKNVVISLEYAL